MFGFSDKTQLVENDHGGLDSTRLTSNEVIQAVTTRYPVLSDVLKAAIVNLGWD